MTSFEGGPWRSGRPARSVLNTMGIVLAVIVCLAGLAMFAYIVLIIVALNNYGSNK